ncbi:bacterial low temperature requirement A protein-domain-containing protein [Fimicolochytrium jonesii]|uniref:bacterial low temperature requirement A protein-domain-containing protein n=1 Tax=Fimicolochytrium jonesii TaxID=1396493 RepID=UPI0022FE08C5|nr:bacterial low temperature requirement A protein-domain-containing protein [Fimicolochytrium jonesii]KAI8819155.1 bacterial low temperature requirement A protein-domain-containing protein [Fimicolochytrium jonesii]
MAAMVDHEHLAVDIPEFNIPPGHHPVAHHHHHDDEQRQRFRQASVLRRSVSINEEGTTPPASTLAPPSGAVPHQTCTRFFRSGSKQFQIVDNPDELPPCNKSIDSNGSETEFCVMGSPQHIAALKTKVLELQKTARDAEDEKELARQRAEQISGELESHKSDLLRFTRTLTNGSSSTATMVHPSIKQYGPIDMEIMPTEEPNGDDEQLSQIFWKKPRIRQYLIRHTTLIREAEERTTTWLELLFDLLFAGIVAILGSAYIGTESPLDLPQFSILFLMSIRPWVDMVMYYNVFASDDVAQKGFIVWIMALVVGLGINCTEAISSTHTIFIVFYLLIRFSFALTYLSYYPLFPQFRASLVQSALPSFVSAVFFISSIFSKEHKYSLWWAGIAFDYLLNPCILLASRYIPWIPRPVHRLAVSIEHLSERNGLFLIIVLGEVMVALFYTSFSATPDLSYVKAVLALILALNLAWIYFDVDGSRQEIHAMRRHAWTGITWNLSHIPMFGAVVLAGVSVEVMVRATDDGAGDHHADAPGGGHNFSTTTYRTFFGSLAVTLSCMTVISLTHRSLHASRLSKRVRTVARMAVAVCFAALAAAASDEHPLMTSAKCVALAAGATLALVGLETWSRLGGISRHVQGVGTQDVKTVTEEGNVGGDCNGMQ